MKRLRWLVILLAGVVFVVAGATSVLAKSSYHANAIHASSFTSNGNLYQWHSYADHYGSGDWYWIGAGQYAMWTFDVSDLQTIAKVTDTAITGSVYLDFAALSTSPSGGSGYSTAVKVFASNGLRGGAVTATLANPWQPHISAFSSGLGWDSHLAVPIPITLWAGAEKITVKVFAVAPGNWIAMNKDALVIGYAS